MADSSMADVNDTTAENDVDALDNDSLSRLQRKLDDLSVMFYTYVGILQRDAPPIARNADEADEVANDEQTRAELATKAPEYAQDIVQTSRDIDACVDAIEDELGTVPPKCERDELGKADKLSLTSAAQLNITAANAAALLADIRAVIASRDEDDK